MAKPLEICCPIHGFVVVDGVERDVVESEVFQRLRRIRQLGWSDLIYPGAMHTRFEHSLGVMHTATQLFDQLSRQLSTKQKTTFRLTEAGLRRWRTIIRLAALCHDLGHGPFSHAAEELLPINAEKGQRYRHEDYSIAIVKHLLPNVDERYPEVIKLIGKDEETPEIAAWRQIISGQLDADRMDYLLRDAHHCGIAYGRHDLRRLVKTVRFFDVDGNLRMGVQRGGRHAAESLLVSRYMMSSRVYKHWARKIFDFHSCEAMKEIIFHAAFPQPDEDGIKTFVEWDDWRVLGEFSAGQGGEHAQRLIKRDIYCKVWSTSELPSAEEELLFDQVEAHLKDFDPFAYKPDAKPWYKQGSDEEIYVQAENCDNEAVPLSRCSTVVTGINPSRRRVLFVPPEREGEAKKLLKNVDVLRNE